MQEILDNKIAKYLVSLLASVIKNESPPPAPNDLNFEHLYKLSNWHSVANIAYYGLVKLSPPPSKENLALFQAACHVAVFIEVWQETEVQKILSSFEEHQIKCMPLKGYIIKHIYPKSDMRTMGDVDILVDETQLKKARDIMIALNYKEGRLHSNHDVYYKNNVCIELHRAIIAKTNKVLYSYFGNGWERARLINGNNFTYEMSEEDNLIYMIGHMAKHYQSEGIGIRYILDIWVYKRYYQNKIDWNYIYNELKRSGLYYFYKSMESLSDYWFEGNSNNTFQKEVAEYVISRGTLDTGININTLNILLKNKNENFNLFKIKYSLWILFPDMQTMIKKFPFLQKAPFLLPFFWVYRGIKTISSKRFRLNFNGINDLTKSDLEKIEDVKHKSGF